MEQVPGTSGPRLAKQVASTGLSAASTLSFTGSAQPVLWATLFCTQ